VAAVGTPAECRDAGARFSAAVPGEHDLGDVVIVPGFLVAHPPPLSRGKMMGWVAGGRGRAGSIPEIVALLQQAAESPPAGLPVRGYGYEQRNLAEQRHPPRFELDAVATDREVYLMNASGHGGVVNSYTLELNGVTRDTP